MRKLYFKTVLPSMLAFAFSGVYAIVDGYFVGQRVGDIGLAAINLAYPIQAFLQAIGTGLGMGGAIHMGICLGGGDTEGQRRYLGTSMSMLILSGLLCSLLLLAGYPILLRGLGASGELYVLAEEYTRFILFGTLFQVLSTGLAPLFRNLSHILYVMFTMIAGFVTNIVMDYWMVFVLDWGMRGAAIATVLGQVVTSVGCLGLFFARHRLHAAEWRPDGMRMRRLLASGLSPFGLTLSPFLVIVLVNWFAVRYGGQAAVAAFAVVSYVTSVVQLLLQGVGDGSQPLMSRFLGEGNPVQARRVCRLADGTALVTALLSAGFVILARRAIPIFFGASPETVGEVEKLLLIVAVGFPAIALIRVSIAYFYSVGHNVQAYTMVYGEPVLLAALLVALLPRLFGLDGVWVAIPFTQLILLCVGLLLRRRCMK